MIEVTSGGSKRRDEEANPVAKKNPTPELVKN